MFMNGGLSPNLSSIQQLDEIKRPISSVDDVLVHDILFSNPNAKVKDFSDKNSLTFGKTAVQYFLKKNHMDHIVVSHHQNNFYYPFGDEDHFVLSIYSGNGMNVYISDVMLYTFSNRTNLNSYEEKLNNHVDPIVRV